MRLALLAPLEHPLVEPYAGGLEKHTVQLAAGLAAAGHAVTLFARAGSVAVPGVELRTDLKGYRAVMGYLRTASFDLLHNNSLSGWPTLMAFRLPYPTVTTLHTPPYRRLLPGVLAARLPGGSQLVSISASLQRQWNPWLGRSVVIHNGVEIERYSFSATAVPETAVWYGRFTPEKAPHLAIIAARGAGYRLDLAGPVDDRSYYAQVVAPLLGEDAVYRGHLSHRELLPLIQRAAVGLFTSVWEEPFGLVIPEMLACGTPVAGFASGAAPELVDDRVSRLVPTGEVRQLAEAIIRAAALDRSTCRTYALERFPLERMINAYAELYRSLLS